MGFTQIVCTTFILGFLVTNKAPLVYQRLRRAADEKAAKARSGSQSNKTWTLFLAFVKDFNMLMEISLLLTALASIWLLVYDNVPELLFIIMMIFLGVGVLQGLRKTMDNSQNIVYLTYATAYDVFTDFEIAFYTVYTVISVLGQIDSYSWFFLHLLDLMMRAPAIQNVAYAVYKPREPLLLTFLLTFIFVYIFTIFAFYYLPNDFYNEELGRSECNALVTCFGTFMRNGLIFGGGIGDYISGELGHVPDLRDEELFIYRALFDLMFFIVVIVLLLNIVFGIIIGTFAQLREEQTEQKEQMTQKCAVCSITKDEIELLFAKKNKRDGFEIHIKEEHNMWNYLFYIIYLYSLDKTELSGVESYVFDQLGATPDLGWMPLRIALCQEEE